MLILKSTVDVVLQKYTSRGIGYFEIIYPFLLGLFAYYVIPIFIDELDEPDFVVKYIYTFRRFLGYSVLLLAITVQVTFTLDNIFHLNK